MQNGIANNIFGVFGAAFLARLGTRAHLLVKKSTTKKQQHDEKNTTNTVIEVIHILIDLNS